MHHAQPKLLQSKMFWVGMLYFAEGFPLGIFFDVFPVQFRQEGISLSDIGLLSLLGLAWTLKFLWAPAVDRFRHHRRWMLVVDLGMGAVLLAFAVHHGFGPWVWLAIGLFTLFSATNDIAIDGYTIELLDKGELGLANGIRIGLYRVGMLAAGLLLVLSHWVGWTATYLVGAALLGLLGLICLRAPRERPVVGEHESLAVELRVLLAHPLAWAAVIGLLLGALWLVERTTHWSAAVAGFWYYAVAAGALLLVPSLLRRRKADGGAEELTRGPLFGALLEILQRPAMGPVLLFILIFKLGDAAMGFMVKPFWVDAGFNAQEIGMVSVNIGLALSIAGGVAGGWITDRVGIFHALWSLGLCQAVSNLGYAWAASALPLHPLTAIPFDHQLLLYAASGLESFTGGLGTAAFLAFLMSIVDRRRSAAEYALLSSVFALSRSVAGWAGGFGAESMGYAPYFLLTFFLSFPAFLLLPWVRRVLNGNPPATMT